MIQYRWLFSLVFLAALTVSAQIRSKLPTEQIYLAPHTVECSRGDTLWVEGQVTCIEQKSVLPYSRYLYLELIGNSDSVYVRQKLSCGDGGRFVAAVPTESCGVGGVYYLRAYTNFMRNFSPAAFAEHPVAIGMSLPRRDEEISISDVDCMIGTGGEILAGVPRRLSAVLTCAGYPMESRRVSLIDMTSGDDTVAVAQTSPSGYASFGFIPVAGHRYAVDAAMGDGVRRFLVPETVDDGVQVMTRLKGRSLFMELSDGARKVKGHRVFVYNRDNGLSEISIEEQRGAAVSLSDEPKGPVTLFLTDAALNVIYETTMISRVPERGVQVDIPDVIASGERPEVTVSGIDTSSVRTFIRLVADNDPWSQPAEAALVYTAEYESLLPFPSCSMGTSHDFGDISAWLSESKLKRFALKDVVNADTQVYGYHPESRMLLRGTVYDRHRDNKPVRGGTISALDNVTFAGRDTIIGADGRFCVEVSDFADGTSFFLQPHAKSGKAVSAKVDMDDNVYPSPGVWRRVHMSDHKASTAVDGGVYSSGGSINLPDVTVKAVVVRTNEVNDKSFYQFRIKDREEIERRNYLTLEDILRDMPFIEVIKDNKAANWEDRGPVLKTKRGSSTLKGTDKMAFVVDGVKVTGPMTQRYFEMSAQEVESVEQLTPAEALFYVDHPLNGAVMVETRKLAPNPQAPSKGSIVRPKGLASVDSKDIPLLDMVSMAGRYRLIVDVISSDEVRSYVSSVTVR